MTDFCEPVGSETDFKRVLGEPCAVVYKHSPLCGLSDMAYEQIAAFARSRPEVPIFLIDVIRHRTFSRVVAERLEIRHESPQVIVLRGGNPVWNASHRGVTAEAIEESLAGAVT